MHDYAMSDILHTPAVTEYPDEITSVPPTENDETTVDFDFAACILELQEIEESLTALVVTIESESTDASEDLSFQMDSPTQSSSEDDHVKIRCALRGQVLNY